MSGNGGAVFPHASRQQEQALTEEVTTLQVQTLKQEVTSLRRRLKDAVADVPECSICLDTVTHPVELEECRHLYCCHCFYKHVNSGAVGSRACPLCRCRISKAPLAVPTCLNELLERLKKEKERQEQEAAGGGNGGAGGAGDVRRQDGKKRKRGGWPVAGLPPSGAGATLGEGPDASKDEERGYVDAAAMVSAARVARHTYNLQMDDMSVMFDVERQRRDRVQQRRGARAGGGEGEEEEEEEGVILYYAPEDVFWCPLCGFEVEDDEAHTCEDEDDGEEEDGEQEEADQEEVGAGMEEDEHKPQRQQQEQEQQEEQDRHDDFPAYQPTQLLSDMQTAALGMARSAQNPQPSTEGCYQQQQLQQSFATAQHNQHGVLSPADRQATEEAATKFAEELSCTISLPPLWEQAQLDYFIASMADP